MAEVCLLMSAYERERSHLIRETVERKLRQREAAERLAGIVAITAATLARMPAPVVCRAMHEHPDVCDRVIAVLVGQIRSLTNRVNEPTGLNMRYRLIAALPQSAMPAPSVPGRVRRMLADASRG